MTLRGANREKVSALLRCISLGAFAGLLLFLSDGVSCIAQPIASVISSQYFFISAFCTGICCGFFFAIRGVWSATATFYNLGFKAGFMAVSGFAVFFLALFLPLPAVAFIPFGMLFGYGTGMLGIGKGMLLSGLEERQFLHSVLFAIFIAGLIKILLLLLPAMWLYVCIIILLIVSAFMPLSLCAPDIVVKSRNKPIARLAKEMIERNWIFLCNLLLCLLVNSLPWAITFTEETIVLAHGLDVRKGTAVGSMITSLLLLLLTRDRIVGRLQAATPVIPLICTANILLTWYLVVWEGGFNLFGGYRTTKGEFIASIAVGFSTILGLFILLWRIRKEVDFGLSPAFIYGIFIVFIAGLFLVFIVLQYNLVQAILTGFDSVLRIIFLVVTAIYVMKDNHRTVPMATPVPPDQRIQNIGVLYGLSKREIEILALLMERRSAPYIADVEFIALSTVKTHIKHIYLKTGTHNRKELLDIVSKMDSERLSPNAR